MDLVIFLTSVLPPAILDTSHLSLLLCYHSHLSQVRLYQTRSKLSMMRLELSKAKRFNLITFNLIRFEMIHDRIPYRIHERIHDRIHKSIHESIHTIFMTLFKTGFQNHHFWEANKAIPGKDPPLLSEAGEVSLSTYPLPVHLELPQKTTTFERQEKRALNNSPLSFELGPLRGPIGSG